MKRFLIGCGGALAILFVIVIVAVAVSAGRSGTTPSQPAAADRTATPGAPAATKAPAHQPQVLLELNGSGTKTTQKFSAGGDWDLNWDYDCSKAGGSGNFIVEVFNGDGSPSISNQGVNQLGDKGQDVDHFHRGGQFYLQVISECSWHVKAVG